MLRRSGVARDLYSKPGSFNGAVVAAPKSYSGGLEMGRTVWARRWGIREVVRFLFTAWIALFGLLSGVAVPKTAQAVGATVTISTKNTSVVKGDVVYVIITVSSPENIKGFAAYFTYDNRILRYAKGGGLVHGNDDAFLVDDTERSESTRKLTYSIKFIARKEGDTEISLRKPYRITADDDSGSRMSVSYNTLGISVKSKREEGTNHSDAEDGTAIPATPEPTEESLATASPTPTNNANASSNKLRKLSVKGAQLTPDFSPEIQKYSTLVKTSKDSIPISYETEDSQAKVVVKGNKNLTKGKHIIKIAVTGTDGRKRVYRLSLNIQKEKADTASHVTVSDKDGKISVSGNTKIVLSDPDEAKVPSGFVRTETEIGGKTVPSYRLESSKKNNYVLLYGKGDREGFYLYDQAEDMLLPYEKVKSWYRSLDGESIGGITQEGHTIQILKYVVGIMAALCGLMFLLLLAFRMRRR